MFTVVDALKEHKQTIGGVWIVNNVQEADLVCKNLRLFGGYSIEGFDSRVGQVLPSRVERMRKIKTMELLALLRSEKRRFLVLPYFELLKRSPDLDFVEKSMLKLEKGKKLDLMSFYESLIAMGYEISEDSYLQKGTYFRSGDVLMIFPVNSSFPLRLSIGFDTLDSLEFFDQDTEEKDVLDKANTATVWPIFFEESDRMLTDVFRKDNLVVEDDLEIYDEFYEDWNASFNEVYSKNQVLSFVTFNEDEKNHIHLHYLSVLRYRGAYDLVNDFKEKVKDAWNIIFFTKKKSELVEILSDNKLKFNEDLSQFGYGHYRIFLVEIDKECVFPQAFQNPENKLMVLSDRDISSLQEERKSATSQKVFMDFLASLKVNDYVVHVDHGIGLFLGLEQRTIDGLTKEYLKIGYAENDKLFVPIDQADKINKFVGADENLPKLTRLGSAEWNSITKKVKNIL